MFSGYDSVSAKFQRPSWDKKTSNHGKCVITLPHYPVKSMLTSFCAIVLVCSHAAIQSCLSHTTLNQENRCQ